MQISIKPLIKTVTFKNSKFLIYQLVKNLKREQLYCIKMSKNCETKSDSF